MVYVAAELGLHVLHVCRADNRCWTSRLDERTSWRQRRGGRDRPGYRERGGGDQAVARQPTVAGERAALGSYFHAFFTTRHPTYLARHCRQCHLPVRLL